MSSSTFRAMDTSHDPTSNKGCSDGDIASATNSVTEQFQFIHVSGNCDNTIVQNLARNFMSTLGITNPDDEKYAEQLAALTNQVSQMMKPSEPNDPVQGPEARSSSDGGIPTIPSSSQQSQSPKVTKDTSKSKSQPTNNKDRGRSPRRHRSRSRTPIGRIVEGIRSRSPFRRKKGQSRSPNRPVNRKNSSENIVSDIDNEEFFDSRMDSFTVNSPPPQAVPKSTSQSDDNNHRPPPTPTSAGRPPLASVHLSEAACNNGNSPIIIPQGQSMFKFDKEHDKFNMGSSFWKNNTTFGSPGKKGRSPASRPKTKTPSPASQRENHFDVSPLSEMGSVSGTTPFQPSTNPKTNSKHLTAHNTENTASFFSPVPEFHAPHAFVGNSGTRRIPTPHNILQNDQSPEAANRRQNASPGMESDAATAARSFGNGLSLDPKTPFAQPKCSEDIPDTAPDTAETFIKKKTRNSATPNIVDAAAKATQQQIFNVDLGSNAIQSKGNSRRGNTLRKGFKKASMSFKAAGKTKGVFGLDEIKEVGTDATAPTATESPSNGSAISMDTSPLFSPPPQQQSTSYATSATGILQGLNNPAEFHVGISDIKPRNRSKRKENGGRRAQFNRSQSEHVVYGPSRSLFDLNHLSKNRSDIMALKDEGKKFYLGKQFRESTRVYSQAIQNYKIDLFAHDPSKDLLALLLWNRAAALLMIGAYECAADDARFGIHYATDPTKTDPALASPDANPLLRPKLYCRMGRSYLKLGKVDDADRAFSEAILSATTIQDFHRNHNILGMFDELEKIKTEATLERREVSRLSTLMQEISSVSKQRKAVEVLGLIKQALSTANGSRDLHIEKVKMLAESKRWREVVSHCERFAASNTKFDGCLLGDISRYNPFPGVPVAKYLHANYFGDTKEDELEGAEMKLSNDAAAEAILRLPDEMMPYYLRSLRLEERYYNAEKCIRKLEEHISDRAITMGTEIFDKFSWLQDEQNKQRQTKTNRNNADSLFTNGKYEEAAKSYAVCLLIDSDGSSCAGGRLHAILHCNRAACFMALKRFREAMTECTAALRIYPRYLKAILRRARCHSRLDQTRQAQNDFRHWLKIMKQSKNNGSITFLGANVFHGPDTVKAKEIEEVQDELDDLLKAKAREEEAKAREENARNMYKERSRQWNSERFDFNSSGNGSAHKRRENFYNSSKSQRWDSFKNQDGRSKPKNNTTSQNRSSKRTPKDHKSFYSLLELTHRAADEEIRKAYKKKALKCHPDKNPNDPKAADNFRRVKEAYETLNDPKLRRQYDAGR